MKLTSDDAYYACNQLIEAVNWLEISLSNAKTMLEREDVPPPHERVDRAAEAASDAEADLSVGDVGQRIQLVIDTLEELGEELPNE